MQTNPGNTEIKWTTIANIMAMPEYEDCFSIYQLRRMIRRRYTNGLASYVSKISERKYLIDINGFRRWINDKIGK